VLVAEYTTPRRRHLAKQRFRLAELVLRRERHAEVALGLERLNVHDAPVESLRLRVLPAPIQRRGEVRPRRAIIVRAQGPAQNRLGLPWSASTAPRLFTLRIVTGVLV
jgi:hypothetical protein